MNRDFVLVSVYYGGKKHCGTEAGGRSDGTFACGNAALYAGGAAFFRDYRAVFATAGACVSKDTE